MGDTDLTESVTDLNADVGESFGAWKLGDDQALMQVITSASVACGFHAGDPLTLRQTCAMAAAAGVTIGAQVSYRDLAGFGRRDMAVPADELAAELLYQIAALDGIARAEGSRVRYVKPHGALYNRVGKDQAQATALVDAIRAYDPTLPLLTQAAGEAAELAAAAGIRVVAEAFADRQRDQHRRAKHRLALLRGGGRRRGRASRARQPICRPALRSGRRPAPARDNATNRLGQRSCARRKRDRYVGDGDPGSRRARRRLD